jgi:hypothetical protein
MTTWNWVSNNANERIEGNIIKPKPPYKVVDVVNVLLVRLWGKNCLKKPTPVVNLANVSYFLQGRNCLPHYGKLLGSILDLFHCNGLGVASINKAFVIPNWNPYSTLIKHLPIFLDKGSNLELN